MSESVACCLEYLDNKGTQQTRLFIQMIDYFFNCLNARSPLMATWKRKAGHHIDMPRMNVSRYISHT